MASERDQWLRVALRTYGEVSPPYSDWPGKPEGYVEKLELTEADVSTLVEIANDWRRWYEEDFDESDAPAMDAPIHAWRALAELGSASGIGPMIQIAREMGETDCDWLFEGVQQVLGCFGASAIEPLEELANDESVTEWTRAAAIDALARIGSGLTERDRCVRVLKAKISRFEDETPFTNYSTVSALLELRGIEALHDIRRAYESGAVDDDFGALSWRDVHHELTRGKPRRANPVDVDRLRRIDTRKTDRTRKKAERKRRRKSRR